MPSTSEHKKIPEFQGDIPPDTRDANGIGGRSRDAGQNARDARTIGEKTAETAARTTDAAADMARDMTRGMADRGQEAVQYGLRAMAGVQAPVAESYDQSRRLVDTTARVTDIYNDAAQRTADDVQALSGSFFNLGCGVQRYQLAYLDLVSRSMESVARKQQELFRVTSPIEFAEIQRDLYVDAVNILVTGSTTLLQVMGQITQDAMRPLQERAGHV